LVQSDATPKASGHSSCNVNDYVPLRGSVGTRGRRGAIRWNAHVEDDGSRRYGCDARLQVVGQVKTQPHESGNDRAICSRFLFLGSHFNYASKWTSITVKVLIQQFWFAPIFNTYFFGVQALLSGAPPSVIIHRVVSAVPESVVSSAKFWPAVTALNFTLIPAHLRFAFSGVFAVIWQTYLSYLNRREEMSGSQGTLADTARQKLCEDAPAASVVDVLDGLDSEDQN
jgi:hypothetical protein